MYVLIDMSAPHSFYHKRRKFCSSRRSSVGEGTEYLDKWNKVILTQFFAGEMLVLSCICSEYWQWMHHPSHAGFY